MRARAQQFGHAAHQTLQLDRRRIELQRLSLQPGVVQQVVDQAQQMLGRLLRGLRIGALGAVQTGARQQAQHADHPVQGRAHLMAHQPQELVLGRGAVFRRRRRSLPRFGRGREKVALRRRLATGLSHKATLGPRG